MDFEAFLRNYSESVDAMWTLAALTEGVDEPTIQTMHETAVQLSDKLPEIERAVRDAIHNADANTLRTELESAQTLTRQLTDARDTAITAGNAAREEAEKLSSALSKQKDKTEEIQRELNGSKATVEQQNTVQAESDTKIKNLEAARNTADTEMTKLKTELKELQKKLEHERTKPAKKLDDLRAAKKAVEESAANQRKAYRLRITEYKTRIETLTEANATLQSDVDTTRASNITLRARSSMADEMRAALERLQADHPALKGPQTSAAGTSEAQQQSIVRGQTVEQISRYLKDQEVLVKRLRGERDHYRTNCFELDQAYKGTTQMNANLKGEIVGKQLEFDKSATANKKFDRTVIDGLKKRINEQDLLTKDLASLVRQQSQMTSSLEGLEAKVAELKADNDRLGLEPVSALRHKGQDVEDT